MRLIVQDVLDIPRMIDEVQPVWTVAQIDKVAAVVGGIEEHLQRIVAQLQSNANHRSAS